jgi:hypothetical protein
MLSTETKVARLEAAFAKEHDYVFDEGDKVKSSHGQHIEGALAFVTEDPPSSAREGQLCFVPTTSTLSVWVGTPTEGAWEAVGGGA